MRSRSFARWSEQRVRSVRATGRLLRRCALVCSCCALLLACSAPESDNHALRCSATRSCPEERVCYRGFCVADGLDPSTGGPASNEPGVDVGDSGSLEDAAQPSEASTSKASEESPADAGGAASAASSEAGSVDVSLASTHDAAAEAPSTPPVPVDAGPSSLQQVVDAGVATSAPPSAPVPPPTAPPLMIPVVDAGLVGNPCATPCSSPAYNEKQCNQCVKDTYGESPSKLCKGGNDDDEPLISLKLEPVCVSLCLGAAKKNPACIGLN